MSVPTAFRLDTLAVHLVERLEAGRRAHLDAPEAARAAIARGVEEGAAALARECRDVLGDEAQARFLEREAREAFLPRYARLALAQNAIEAGGLLGPLGDGLLARVVVTAGAAAFAYAFGRFLPGAGRVVVYSLVLLAPVLPELRAAWIRRRWRALLQELADDLGRLQAAHEALPVLAGGQAQLPASPAGAPASGGEGAAPGEPPLAVWNKERIGEEEN